MPWLLFLACSSTKPESMATCADRVDGDVVITTEEDAVDLCATAGTVGGALTLTEVEWTDLSPISCICVVEGPLQIQKMLELQSLTGMERLERVGGVSVAGTPRLLDFTGFPLAEIDGDLELGASGPRSFRGLENLGIVTGGIHGYGCSLEETTGLEGLTTIGGTFDFTQSEKLMSVSGMDALTSVSGIWLRNNNTLQSITAFSAISSLSSKLDFSYNPQLSEVSGLTALTSVAEDLTVIDDDRLPSLSGLTALQHIGGDLDLEDLAVLSDVQALQTLQRVDGNLIIRNNPQLSQSQVDQVLSQVTVGGSTQVYNNNGP